MGMSRKELSSLDRIALGRSPITREFKFGANLDVANSATEDLWGSDTDFIPLTANTQFEIVSTDDADSDVGGVKAQGAGVRTVRVYAIKADWTIAQEDVVMDGTQAVNLASTYMGVYKLEALTAGATGNAVGKISVVVDGAGAAQCFMEIGKNQSEHAIFPVPAGLTALIDDIFVGTNKSSGIIINMNTLNTLGTSLKTHQMAFRASTNGRSFTVPFKVAEKTWIIWSATNSSGGAAYVSADMNIRLVPNSMVGNY